jgi:hypothetical protein
VLEQPILSNRPFNINDGNLYIILIKDFDNTFVFNNTGTLLHRKLINCRTYKTFTGASKAVDKYFTQGMYNEVLIKQVKDILTPLYYIKLIPPNPANPYHEIKIRKSWGNLIDPSAGYYFDNEIDAQNALNSAKGEIIEYYYQKILNLKKITL